MYANNSPVLVTTRATVQKPLSTATEERDNVVAVNWHMQCSKEPMHYIISLNKKSFSHQLLLKSHAFVVNNMPGTMKDTIEKCGQVSGRNVDKFSKFNVFREPARTVDCPRLKDAKSFIECKVSSVIDCGDHSIFIGKVLFSSKGDG